MIPPGCEAWVPFGLKEMEAVAGDRGLPWPPTRMSGGGSNLKANKGKGKGKGIHKAPSQKSKGKAQGKMNQKEKAKWQSQQKRTKLAKEAKLAKALGTRSDALTELQRLLVCSARLAISDVVMRFRQISVVKYTRAAQKAMK